MTAINKIYNDELIANLDPVKDKKEIFKINDLDWEYQLKPLLYYDNDKNLTVSGSKLLVINRDGVLKEVAVRGKDFQVTPVNRLYDVFIDLMKPLNLSLHAIGHTREGKFIYIVAKFNNPISELEKEISVNRYLMIYTVNDGNGKTKFAPILLSSDEIEYQISTISSTQENGKKRYISYCYELSHHFQFDSLEASIAVKNAINEHIEEFENKLTQLLSIPASKAALDEFNYRIYKRFEIGNEKTKRGYVQVTTELCEYYGKYNNSLNSKIRDTLGAIYLSFVSYLDRQKKRKMGKDGRITSINFTHDNVTKRVAFEEIIILASELLN